MPQVTVTGVRFEHPIMRPAIAWQHLWENSSDPFRGAICSTKLPAATCECGKYQLVDGETCS